MLHSKLKKKQWKISEQISFLQLFWFFSKLRGTCMCTGICKHHQTYPHIYIKLCLKYLITFKILVKCINTYKRALLYANLLWFYSERITLRNFSSDQSIIKTYFPPSPLIHTFEVGIPIETRHTVSVLNKYTTLSFWDPLRYLLIEIFKNISANLLFPSFKSSFHKYSYY